MECRDIIISEDYGDLIVGFNSGAEDFVKKYSQFCPSPIGVSYGTIFVPLRDLKNMKISNYSYEDIPKLYGFMDLVAVEATGALKLQNLPGLELKGTGTIVCVVTDGIDVYHEAFRYSNGETRILAIWDQTNQDYDTPETQQYGSLITREIINEELKKENSKVLKDISKGSTHGTFVTGIAAGSNNLSSGFASPAPNADIVVVKLKPAKKYLREYYLVNDEAAAYQENDILNAIIFFREIGFRAEKPVIMCIPLGTSQGAHNGLSTMGDILNSSGGRAGIGIVIANGNEGNSRHHYSGEILDNGEYDDVEIRVGDNVKGFMLELWGQSPDLFSVAITSPSGETIEKIPAKLDTNVEYNFLFEKTVVNVTYRIVEIRSGNQLIQMRFDKPSTGIWKIRVFGENIITGRFNMWLPITEFVGNETYFLKPDPFITVTNPADAFIPISVGAYSTSSGGLLLQSGRGYPTDMTVKPTFAAPGVDVYGPSANNSYTVRSGTSVAAGITTGIVAQFMEWGIVRGNKKNLNTTQIKNYLIRGANRQDNEKYPNREMGYGTLDAFNSLDILRK